MGHIARALALVGISLGLVYCSSSSSDSQVCDPGRQISCPCPGGTPGVQACLSDGSGYAKCQCGDAGTDGSAGTGGGQGGSGGSTGGSGGASGTGGSSGAGGSSGDASTTCAAGKATNLTGSCDLEAQNCTGGLTCDVQSVDGGGVESACLDLGDGPSHLGEACNTHSDCAAGLICALAKCTRVCCPDLQTECGAGACDMQISYPNGFMQICTFSASCTPWTHDCPAGPESDCHVGSGGTLKCSFPNYTVDGGSTLGNPCTYLNDCADSQACDYSGSTGVCRWLCKLNDTGAPDAGVVGGTPGNGGCPSGETCVPYSTLGWLGVCRP